MWMYTASAIASIYALSSLCLIFGITHNKSEFILPWLVVDMIGVLLTIDVMFYFSHGCAIIDFVGGSRNYCELNWDNSWKDDEFNCVSFKGSIAEQF